MSQDEGRERATRETNPAILSGQLRFMAQTLDGERRACVIDAADALDRLRTPTASRDEGREQEVRCKFCNGPVRNNEISLAIGAHQPCVDNAAHRLRTPTAEPTNEVRRELWTPKERADRLGFPWPSEPVSGRVDTAPALMDTDLVEKPGPQHAPTAEPSEPVTRLHFMGFVDAPTFEKIREALAESRDMEVSYGLGFRWESYGWDYEPRLAPCYVGEPLGKHSSEDQRPFYIHPVPEDTESSEVERLREALEFYTEKAEALARYAETKNGVAMEAVNIEMLNDGGKRGRAALNLETEG